MLTRELKSYWIGQDTRLAKVRWLYSPQDVRDAHPTQEVKRYLSFDHRYK